MRADLTSPQAFEALVREHQSMVFRTLSRMTGAGSHVEDLAQEVFLRLYRALPEFRGDSALTTYLYRIVVNVAQDEWKRRRRDREFVAAAPASLEEDDSTAWLENLPGDTLHGHARTPEQLLSDAELQTLSTPPCSHFLNPSAPSWSSTTKRIAATRPSPPRWRCRSTPFARTCIVAANA